MYLNLFAYFDSERYIHIVLFMEIKLKFRSISARLLELYLVGIFHLLPSSMDCHGTI